jgi:protein-S-isoprenylcysteine O-methyltransferase Ste14
MQNEPLFRWEGFLRIFQIFLLVSAALLFFAGARHYNLLQTLGIHQITKGSTHSVLTESGEVDTTGILGLIRHPWYAGAIGLLWARELDISAIIMNLILTAYLIIGTILEERKLLLEFGDKYRIYQKNASMLIPVKWLMSNIGK